MAASESAGSLLPADDMTPGRVKLTERAAHLSFAGATPSPTEFERMIGTNDLVDEFYLERALVAAKPICRLVLRNPAGREIAWATGFMVSPRLILTNWHVFPTAADAQNAIAEARPTCGLKSRTSAGVATRMTPSTKPAAPVQAM